MKVIGVVSSRKYICEVSHEELEKLTDKYYGNLTTLSVGSEMDLGAGYNFRRDIKDACDRMAEAHKAFGKSSDTMREFSMMVAKRENQGG